MQCSLEAIVRSAGIVADADSCAAAKLRVETRAMERYRIARLFRPGLPDDSLNDWQTLFILLRQALVLGSLNVTAVFFFGWIALLLRIGFVYGWFAPDPVTTVWVVMGRAWAKEGIGFRVAWIGIASIPCVSAVLTFYQIDGYFGTIRNSVRRAFEAGGDARSYIARVFCVQVDTTRLWLNVQYWGLLSIIEEVNRRLSSSEREQIELSREQCHEEHFEALRMLWLTGKHRRRLAQQPMHITLANWGLAWLILGCGVMLSVHFFKFAIFVCAAAGKLHPTDIANAPWYLAGYLVDSNMVWAHVVGMVLAMWISIHLFVAVSKILVLLREDKWIAAVRKNSPQFVRAINEMVGIGSTVAWRDEKVDSPSTVPERWRSHIESLLGLLKDAPDISVVMEVPALKRRAIGPITGRLITDEDVAQSRFWHVERILSVVRRGADGKEAERFPVMVLAA